MFIKVFFCGSLRITTRSKRHNTTGEGHCRKFVRKIRSLRDDINQRHRNFINNIGELDINTHSTQAFQEAETEQRLYTPGSVMLMKVFMAADRYFDTLYKARLNGELTETEYDRRRNKMAKQITRNLNQVNVTCLSFHKVRKEAEASI
ncbi:DUF1845 domain-containing protein [Vibrio parahaemolyticus]|nr:DUF1845 domain-containing protein [Vibrio parahaemolyticus]MDN4712441.1 DUF1845 domain-containing protein [Vibrio parahaemolyticus]MDN4716496.1 DUF1845 domain-containing protein [Vibrio parahaemolyticus]